MIVKRFIFLCLTLLFPLSLTAAKCKLVIDGQCRKCQDTIISPNSPNCVCLPTANPLPIDGCRTYKNALAATPLCIKCPANQARKKNCETLPSCSDTISSQNPSFCIECAKGQMPTGDLLKCLPTIPNCQEYSKSSVFSNSCHICVKCKAKFLLSQDGVSCIKPNEIDNCLKYPANKKLCDVCKPDCILTANKLKCLPKIDNCLIHDASDNKSGILLCIQCVEGMTFTADRRSCLTLIPNCQQYSPSSTFLDNYLVCVKCQANFTLSQNGLSCQRILGIENCQRMTPDNTGCEVCLQNFILTSNRLKCLPQTINCVLYESSLNGNGQLQCRQCSEGFNTTADRRRCLPSIANCVQYLQSTNESSNRLVCIKCSDNFLLLQNGLVCQQILSIENCQMILNDYTGCEICLPGFVLASNRLKCLPEIPNCISYNSSLNANGQLQCNQCIQGMITTGDKRKCLPLIMNCEQYSQTTTASNSFLICIKCSANFMPSQNGTICKQIISIENCQRMLPNDSGCELCLPNFVLAANRLKCLAEIQNCISYNALLNQNGQLECNKCAEGLITTGDKRKCLPVIPNCEQYSSTTTISDSRLVCVRCQANFQLNQNGFSCQRINFIENCQRMLADNSGCEVCLSNFVLTMNRLQCLYEIPNCISYNSSLNANGQLQCNQCAAGLTTTGDRRRCLPLIPNCEQYSQSTTVSSNRLVCIRCSDNFVLQQNGLVCEQILSIENCQRILSDYTGCEICLPGFVLAANRLKCLPEIQNCISYNSSLNANGQLQSNKCAQGFMTTDDLRKCLPLIPNCVQYSQSNTFYDNRLVCVRCIPNFTLSQNGLVCQQIISVENCQNILADNTGCETCLPGFVLTANRLKCLPQIQNCITYDTILNGNGQLLCTQCAERFVATADRRKCLLSIPNCEQYSQSSSMSSSSLICVRCSVNFQISQNGESCERILMVENCQRMLSNNTGCELCLPGFVLTSNNLKCLPQIPNCLSYESYLSSNGQLHCRECAENFLQNASKTMCLFGVANCQTQIDSPTNPELKICTACISGYRLSNDLYKCLPIVPNCATYDSAGMFDDAFRCIQCDTGFVITTDESQCLLAIPNCNSYFESSQYTDVLRCQECANGFVLNSSGSVCLQGISNCIDYNFQNDNETAITCVKCKEPYVLLSGGRQCILSISNCLEIVLNTSGVPICNKCMTGFVTNSNQTLCFPVIANCKIYRTYNTGDTELFCKTCETGYQETNNGRLCLREIANCFSYQPFVLGDINLKCNTCAYGYRKSENQTECLASISNCKKYMQESNMNSLCLICETGFIVTGDFRKCLAEISGCVTYQQSDQNTVYLSCAVCNFYLVLSPNKQSCINQQEPPCIENCKIYNRSICVVCNEGYSISDNGYSCVFIIEHCFQYRTYNGRIVCAACQEGWMTSTIDQLKCLPKIENCCTYIDSDRNTVLNRCETCNPGFVSYCNGANCQRKIKTCSKISVDPVEGFYYSLPGNLIDKTVMLKRCDDNTYLSSFYDNSARDLFSLSYGSYTYSQNSMWIISESKQNSYKGQNTYSIYSYANSQTSSLIYSNTSLLGSNSGFGLSNSKNNDGQKWAFKQTGPNTYLIKNTQNGLYLDDFNLSVNCPTLFEIIDVNTNK